MWKEWGLQKVQKSDLLVCFSFFSANAYYRIQRIQSVQGAVMKEALSHMMLSAELCVNW